MGLQAYELDQSRYDIAMALGIIHFNNTGDTEKVCIHEQLLFD